MKSIKVVILFLCLTALMSFSPPVAITKYNGDKIILADTNEVEIVFGDTPVSPFAERTAYITIVSASSDVQVATRTIDSNTGGWPAGSKIVMGFYNGSSNIKVKGPAGAVIQITHSK